MTTKDIVFISLFSAITAVLGIFPPLTIPFVAVPVTAQSMGPMLAGAILGSKRGAGALGLFCLLVALGLPLLSGGNGGIGKFMGPTGGFVLSWPIAAFVIGLYFERVQHHRWWQDIAVLTLGGIGLIYLIGVPWMALVLQLTPLQAIIAASVFIPGDLIKVVVVYYVASTLRRAYPMINRP